MIKKFKYKLSKYILKKIHSTMQFKLPENNIPNSIYINAKNIEIDNLNLNFSTIEELEELHSDSLEKDFFLTHYIQHRYSALLKSFNITILYKIKIMFIFTYNLRLNIAPTYTEFARIKIKNYNKQIFSTTPKKSIDIKYFKKNYDTNFKPIYIFLNDKTHILISTNGFNYSIIKFQGLGNNKRSIIFNHITLYNLNNSQIQVMSDLQLYPKNVLSVAFKKDSGKTEYKDNSYNFYLMLTCFKFKFDRIKFIKYFSNTFDTKEDYTLARKYLDLYTQYYNSPYSIGQRDQLKRYIEFFESRDNSIQRLLFWIHEGHWNIFKPLCTMLLFILADALLCYFYGYIEIIKESSFIPIYFPFGDYIVYKLLNTAQLIECYHHPAWAILIIYITNLTLKLGTIYTAWLAIIGIKKRFFSNKIPKPINNENQNK